MGLGRRLEDKDEVVSEINVTPLVDVMLVLLIIFIITLPVMTHAVKLDLPHVQNQPNIVPPQTITLSVTADGTVFWDGKAVDEVTLADYLHVAAAKQPQPEIHIRGDRKAAYEYVVKTMAAAQRAGIQKLGFITQPD